LNSTGGGIFLICGVEVLTLLFYLIINYLLGFIHPLLSWLFNLYVLYSCLALKDLFYHIHPVVSALRSDNLPEARDLIAMVVGRDVKSLNKKGIIKAAIETIAENIVDGFISPAFWFLIGGILGYVFEYDPIPSALCFMLSAKVASTLDSMVGYKSAEYIDFGKAGARYDDIMAFIPARISLIILFFGAWISGNRSGNGLKVALRDRLKHDSPNAAHAESFIAGALNIRLGGPTRYQEGLIEKPWLGEEYGDPDIDHIRETERIATASAWSFVISVCLVLLIMELVT
jgi:adenosylcobinamide-phosphate synthase